MDVTTNQPAGGKTLVRSAREWVEQWLPQLDVALQSANRASVASLFAPDGHWRDLLAFTWSITPCEGAANIAALMVAKQAAAGARAFAVAEGRTPPRRIQRAGMDFIEGIFRFETAVGRGFGVVRLLAAQPAKAFQLMTSLHELKGFEERVGKRRPTGEAFSRNFGGTNWKEQRDAAQLYTDREPTVLIAGGGQAGLSLAATLVRIGVDALVVDKFPRVGDCWRQRDHSLALHTTEFTNGANWRGKKALVIGTGTSGHYLDAGCSQLIIDGEVGLLQFDQIEKFVKDGALLRDGSVKRVDLIVLATGFVAQEIVVAKLLGNEVAKKIGPVWGFGADGEMSNMWKRTAQEGLWFVGGSFANCRTYSRYVAMQIKAIEEGMLPRR